MANLVVLKNTYGDNGEFVKVKYSAALDDGMLVVANTLSTTEGEEDVYVATAPTAISDTDLALICAEEYYEDANGNRINITDPTKITYPIGSVVRAVKPHIGRKFFVSTGAITGTAAVDGYLIPTAGTGLGYSASVTATVKFALKIESITAFVNKGNQIIEGVIARVVLNAPEPYAAS